MWMKSNGYAHLSIVELLHAEKSPEVGPTEVLLSHVQSEAYEATIWSWQHVFLFPEMMRSEHLSTGPHSTAQSLLQQRNLGPQEKDELLDKPHPKVFVDYFCIRQCQSNDFTLPSVVGSIMTSMRTLVAFDVDTYLARTFCLFELFQSIIQGCDIQFKICGSAEGKAALMKSYLAGTGMPPVKAQDAQCRSQTAKDSIDAVIKKGVGFEFLNQRIEQSIEEVLKQTDECNYQFALSKGLSTTWWGHALPANHRLFQHVDYATFQNGLQYNTSNGNFDWD